MSLKSTQFALSGAQFRAIRTRLGWSQAAMAERLGVTRQTVWEQERAAVVRPAYALAVAALEQVAA